MAFLPGAVKPTLGIVYTDALNHRHFKTYIIPSNTNDTLLNALTVGSMQQPHLDAGTNMILSVVGPHKGFLVVGERAIVFMNERHSLSVSMAPTSFVAATEVSSNQFLLAEKHGLLLMLEIAKDATRAASLNLHCMGATSIASSLSYMGDGLAFVGSHVADSQVVELPSESSMDVVARNHQLPVLDSLTNLAPITDFVVVDTEKQGQVRHWACMGMWWISCICRGKL